MDGRINGDGVVKRLGAWAAVSPGLVPAKDVACSANGSDGIGLVTLREQPSQPADMDVDGPVIDIRRLVPNVVEELGPGENAPLVFHEEFKKPIFGGAKSYLAPRSRDFMGAPVNDKFIRNKDVVKSLGRAAAKQISYTRDQLRHRKRLGDVVVGPREQAANAVLFGTPGGEEDDWKKAG